MTKISWARLSQFCESSVFKVIRIQSNMFNSHSLIVQYLKRVWYVDVWAAILGRPFGKLEVLHLLHDYHWQIFKGSHKCHIVISVIIVIIITTIVLHYRRVQYTRGCAATKTQLDQSSIALIQGKSSSSTTSLSSRSSLPSSCPYSSGSSPSPPPYSPHHL